MNSAAHAIADFIETRHTALLDRLRQAVGVDSSLSPRLLEEWIRNEVDFFRTGANHACEWMALFVARIREKGGHINEVLFALRQMRRALIGFCLGQVPDVCDSDVYEVLLRSEDHLLAHAWDLYNENEMKLAVAEQRCRKTITDSMHQAFLLLDKDGVIQLANAYCSHLLMAPEDRLVGQNFLSLCDKETAAEIRRDLRQKRGTASPSHIGTFAAPQGNPVNARLWVAPLFDAEGLRNGLAISIAEEDQTAAIQRPHAKLVEGLANALGIGFFLVDASLRVVAANEAGMVYAQVGNEDPQPQCCRRHLDANGQCADCLRRRPFETGLPDRATVRMRTLAGEDHWVELVGIPLRNEQGAVASVAKFARDVTEQKLLEKLLLEQQRTSLMTQLPLTVAHQLRNPLGVMIGFAELLARGMPPEQMSTVVEKILRNGMRCKEIVENLLEFGRAAREDYVAMDLNALVRQRIQPLYAGRAMDRIVWKLTPNLNEIEGAPDQLVLVLLHLIDNAQAAAQSRISVETSELDNGVAIRVWDDGPPMPPECREHLFEPFYTTHNAEGGMGLALSLSRRIIEEHGGKLYLDEAAAGGTAFVVYLPARCVTPPLHEEPPERDLPTPPNRRILIVEDDADQVFMLSLALHGKGYEIDVAANGAQGVERINRVEYDAVVIDMLLGDGLGGRELFQILSQKDPALAQRTLFMTGDTMKYETRRFLSEARRPFLEKPFMMTQFAAEVRNIVETASGR